MIDAAQNLIIRITGYLAGNPDKTTGNIAREIGADRVEQQVRIRSMAGVDIYRLAQPICRQE